MAKPNRAGRKLKQIEFGSHVETSVEFLPHLNSPPTRISISAFWALRDEKRSWVFLDRAFRGATNVILSDASPKNPQGWR